MCYMSYSHFAKLFRENYGRSFKEYITYNRLNKAQDLLLHTDYDLNYIALETGSFDCSHFIRTYKK
ncbi:MAG: helix-turn-helix transcriptional regulator [Ruminococcus sp.]|nr:helix-turn-helix transcriptional regulator [Ruminococcus sp.]